MVSASSVMVRPRSATGNDRNPCVIRLNEVSFGYDERRTLKDVSAVIEPGSFHFLTGPSGAGKTTLMKLLYLEHLPSGGTLHMFGQNLAELDVTGTARMRRRIGVVFQDFRLLDHLSVTDNIALPLRAAGVDVNERIQDVQELVRWVGLEGRADAQPVKLSAGEKQRAAIARAVINSPDLILADEPTGNIDPEMGDRILRLLIELNRLGKTVLIATHDLALIREAKSQVEAHVLRLVNGRLTQGAMAL